jgi:deazaflavin-dependent oxidoreductase (nitroreductase family)
VTEEEHVARGSRQAPPRGVLGWLLAAPTAIYRLGLGWVLGRRFLELVHYGRRTGQRRETVLEVMRFDPVTRESVVMAGWGRTSGWFSNVEAGFAQEVRTGRARYRPAWRVLPREEAAPVMAEYLHRNRWIRPIVNRVLSALLGWSFDGSPAAIERASAELPMIGFRPEGDGVVVDPVGAISEPPPSPDD